MGRSAFAILGLAAMGCLAMTGSGAAGPLDGLRWKARILLVFEQGDGARAAKQASVLASAKAGLAERQMLVVTVPREGRARAEAADAAALPDAEALRQAYDLAPDAPFTILLLGKDGGVKWQGNEPASTDILFGVIDAMPMRRQEMGARRS